MPNFQNIVSIEDLQRELRTMSSAGENLLSSPEDMPGTTYFMQLLDSHYATTALSGKVIDDIIAQNAAVDIANRPDLIERIFNLSVPNQYLQNIKKSQETLLEKLKGHFSVRADSDIGQVGQKIWMKFLNHSEPARFSKTLKNLSENGWLDLPAIDDPVNRVIVQNHDVFEMAGRISQLSDLELLIDKLKNTYHMNNFACHIIERSSSLSAEVVLEVFANKNIRLDLNANSTNGNNIIGAIAAKFNPHMGAANGPAVVKVPIQVGALLASMQKHTVNFEENIPMIGGSFISTMVRGGAVEDVGFVIDKIIKPKIQQEGDYNGILRSISGEMNVFNSYNNKQVIKKLAEAGVPFSKALMYFQYKVKPSSILSAYESSEIDFNSPVREFYDYLERDPHHMGQRPFAGDNTGREGISNLQMIFKILCGMKNNMPHYNQLLGNHHMHGPAGMSPDFQKQVEKVLKNLAKHDGIDWSSSFLQAPWLEMWAGDSPISILKDLMNHGTILETLEFCHKHGVSGLIKGARFLQNLSEEALRSSDIGEFISKVKSFGFEMPAKLFAIALSSSGGLSMAEASGIIGDHAIQSDTSEITEGFMSIISRSLASNLGGGHMPPMHEQGSIHKFKFNLQQYQKLGLKQLTKDMVTEGKFFVDLMQNLQTPEKVFSLLDFVTQKGLQINFANSSSEFAGSVLFKLHSKEQFEKFLEFLKREGSLGVNFNEIVGQGLNAYINNLPNVAKIELFERFQIQINWLEQLEGGESVATKFLQMHNVDLEIRAFQLIEKIDCAKAINHLGDNLLLVLAKNGGQQQLQLIRQLLDRLDPDGNYDFNVNYKNNAGDRLIDIVAAQQNNHDLLQELRKHGSVEPKTPIALAQEGKLDISNGRLDGYEPNKKAAPIIMQKLYAKYPVEEWEIDGLIEVFKLGPLAEYNEMRNTEWGGGEKSLIQIIDLLSSQRYVHDRLQNAWDFKKIVASSIKLINENSSPELVLNFASCLSQLKMCELGKLINLLCVVQDYVLENNANHYAQMSFADFVPVVADVTEKLNQLGDKLPLAIAKWAYDINSNVKPEDWSPYTLKINGLIAEAMINSNIGGHGKIETYHFADGMVPLIITPIVTELVNNHNTAAISAHIQAWKENFAGGCDMIIKAFIGAALELEQEAMIEKISQATMGLDGLYGSFVHLSVDHIRLVYEQLSGGNSAKVKALLGALKESCTISREMEQMIDGLLSPQGEQAQHAELVDNAALIPLVNKEVAEPVGLAGDHVHEDGV